MGAHHFTNCMLVRKGQQPRYSFKPSSGFRVWRVVLSSLLKREGAIPMVSAQDWCDVLYRDAFSLIAMDFASEWKKCEEKSNTNLLRMVLQYLSNCLCTSVHKLTTQWSNSYSCSGETFPPVGSSWVLKSNCDWISPYVLRLQLRFSCNLTLFVTMAERLLVPMLSSYPVNVKNGFPTEQRKRDNSKRSYLMSVLPSSLCLKTLQLFQNKQLEFTDKYRWILNSKMQVFLR